MPKLISIAKYSSKVEAEAGKQFLNSRGIESIISPQGTGASHISLFNGPSELLVDEKNLENAKEVLRENNNHAIHGDIFEPENITKIHLFGRIFAALIIIPFIIFFLYSLVNIFR